MVLSISLDFLFIFILNCITVPQGGYMFVG